MTVKYNTDPLVTLSTSQVMPNVELDTSLISSANCYFDAASTKQFIRILYKVLNVIQGYQYRFKELEQANEHYWSKTTNCVC